LASAVSPCTCRSALGHLIALDPSCMDSAASRETQSARPALGWGWHRSRQLVCRSALWSKHWHWRWNALQDLCWCVALTGSRAIRCSSPNSPSGWAGPSFTAASRSTMHGRRSSAAPGVHQVANLSRTSLNMLLTSIAPHIPHGALVITMGLLISSDVSFHTLCAPSCYAGWKVNYIDIR
jgi:hypothetical protein